MKKMADIFGLRCVNWGGQFTSNLITFFRHDIRAG